MKTQNKTKQNWITIEEAVNLLNTSRTTLYKTIEKHSIKKKKQKGKTYLYFSDVNQLLRKNGQSEQPEQVLDNEKESSVNNYLDKLLDEKDSQIQFLKGQIEEKNNQINNLIKSREHADIMLNDAQKQIFLLQAGTVADPDEDIVIEQSENPKKGIFSRLFRKP
jgi:excisionase family DNA binding protein